MYKTNVKYLCLLTVIIAGFFIFTGGVTSTENDVTYNNFAPQIDDVSASSSPAQIYDKVTFNALVQNKSYEHNSCNNTNTPSSPEKLNSKITILKGSETIATGQYTYKTNFTFDYVFSFPGQYTVISEFTSSNEGDNKTSTKTITLDVKEGSITTLQPGTFTLVNFKHISTSNPTPFEVNGAAALGNSYLTIKGDNTASMHTNATFDPSVVRNYPALTQNYKYDVSGKWVIEKNPNTGLYEFRIEYNNSVYAAYNYTYNGSTMTLSYKDKNNNEFILTFSKN
ncbi:MAG: hypothetical protein HF314_07760 [Ignavibacteria bacterium]|jgi:hypothetical protein|nr:hypothetical protein [Ignavibacteria bacterium]MCU7502953.1 hypothetical protein [Ignavibacteria bacterium]MCU7517064.1 hypothetical protein [Ignavibacteria bacterium]